MRFVTKAAPRKDASPAFYSSRDDAAPRSFTAAAGFFPNPMCRAFNFFFFLFFFFFFFFTIIFFIFFFFFYLFLPAWMLWPYDRVSSSAFWLRAGRGRFTASWPSDGQNRWSSSTTSPLFLQRVPPEKSLKAAGFRRQGWHQFRREDFRTLPIA